MGQSKGYTDAPLTKAQVSAFTDAPLPETQVEPDSIPLRVAKGAGNAVVETAKGVWNAAPIPEALGGSGVVAGPVGAAKNILMGMVDQYRQAKQAEAEGRTSEMVGHSVAAALPGVGPWAANVGEKIANGQAPEAAGELLVGLAAPEALRRAPVAAEAVANAAGSTGQAVAQAARDVAANPVAAAVGAVEGYQAAGIPGAVAGGVGLPVTAGGLNRWLKKAPAPTASADAGWAQEAKNLNARDAFLKKQAAQEAKDLAVHQRMMDKIAAAKTKAEVVAKKEQWSAIIQEAKNLTAREKKLAEIAAQDAADARAKALAEKATEPTTRPDSSNELLDALSSRLESNGLAEAASEFRGLSRKLVLTPAEALRLKTLQQRMKMSASEVGLSYPAAHGPTKKTVK